MADHRKDVVQGTLDLLVLRIIAAQPMHGWGVMQRLWHLANERQNWKSITTAVEKVLEGA